MTNEEAIGRLEIIKKCYPFRYEEGVEFRNAIDLAIKALEERSKVKQIEDNRMVCFDCVHCKVCSLYKKYDKHCDYYKEADNEHQNDK